MIRNEQTDLRILHHVKETVLGIPCIQRLIGTAGLQHAKTCDHHIFTAGDQNGNHILPSQAVATDSRRYTLRDLIQFGIGDPCVLVDHGFMLRILCSRTAEQSNDICMLNRHFRPVEAIKQRILCLRDQGNVPQLLL